MESKVFFGLVFSFCLIACKDNSQVLEQETYEGPSVAMTDIDMMVSDSTVIKLRLVAAKQLVMENEDRDFPEGIYLEFYNSQGLISSTLKADQGHYYADGEYYAAQGNVHMMSRSSNDELSTELLNWEPSEERVYTDKFVTITADGEVLTGEGLEASQDFEEYTILKPSGTMSLLPGELGNIDAANSGTEELIYEEDTTTIE